MWKLFSQKKIPAPDDELRPISRKEIARRGRQPVPRSEFHDEGAHLRDLLAAAYRDMERLGTRVYALEQKLSLREH